MCVLPNKKYLFVCESITNGGMTQILKVLAEHFKDQTEIVILVNDKAIEYYKDMYFCRLVSFPKTLADTKIKNKFIRVFLRIFFYFRSIIFFYFFLKKEKPNLVKIFAGGFPGGDVSWCITVATLLLKKNNTYLSIHGEPNINWSINNWIYNKVAINLLKTYKAVICVSNFQKNLIKDTTQFSNIKLIRNSMPLNKANNYSAERRRKLAKNSDLICLMVANYTWNKGFDTAFKAIMKVNLDSNFKIKLICFGDIGADDFKEISALRDQIDNRELISLFPFSSEIYKYYSIADFCIAPTFKHEAFGLSALESNLHQKPVITSDLPAFKELRKLGLQGFTFKRGNVNDCCKVILKLINRKKSELFFRYDIINRNFSVNKMINSYRKILDDK